MSSVGQNKFKLGPRSTQSAVQNDRTFHTIDTWAKWNHLIRKCIKCLRSCSQDELFETGKAVREEKQIISLMNFIMDVDKNCNCKNS